MPMARSALLGRIPSGCVDLSKISEVDNSPCCLGMWSAKSLDAPQAER
jgi:hypothetical protein